MYKLKTFSVGSWHTILFMQMHKEIHSTSRRGRIPSINQNSRKIVWHCIGLILHCFWNTVNYFPVTTIPSWKVPKSAHLTGCICCAVVPHKFRQQIPEWKWIVYRNCLKHTRCSVFHFDFVATRTSITYFLFGLFTSPPTSCDRKSNALRTNMTRFSLYLWIRPSPWRKNILRFLLVNFCVLLIEMVIFKKRSCRILSGQIKTSERNLRFT